MDLRLATTAPLFAFDENMTVVAWNEAVEELTGIPASEAIGEPCWKVLAGHDDAGGVLCHKQCSRARLARGCWPVATQEMHIRCANGRRRVAVDTISVANGGPPLCLHLLRDAPAQCDDQPERGERPPTFHLTPRQLDVLRLLAEGVQARAIATILGLAEVTVRNHIRAVLLELGVHSQLEAVFQARRHGLV